MNINNQVQVIIRSAGERTEQLSKKLLIEQGLNKSQIHIIKEVPFSKAVIRTFNEGLKADYKWTLGLDSDVLYRKGKLLEQINFADTLPENYFMIQGMVLDKVQLIKRNTGGHLYRTSLIPKALENFEYVSDLDRPEATLNHRMKGLGYPYYNWDKLLSLHDYEQYYTDLFRKGYAQAIKNYTTGAKLSRIWLQLMQNDTDYLMIYLGFVCGANRKEKLGLVELQELAEQTITLLGLSEKDPIVHGINIENSIKDFRLHPLLYKLQNIIIDSCDVKKHNSKKLPNFYLSRLLRKLGLKPEKISGIFN